MPNELRTQYGWIVEDLKDVATRLETLALQTDERITQVEAALCRFHLNKTLRFLILATRISRAQCSSLYPQMQSLFISASPTKTSTGSQ